MTGDLISLYLFLESRLKNKSCPTTHLWRSRGKRRYSSYSFSTSALNGDEWSASLPGLAIPPGKGPPVPIVQERGWAPELVCTQRLKEKSLASARIEPRLSPGRPALKVITRHSGKN
jgi:hypothetical protein